MPMAQPTAWQKAGTEYVLTKDIKEGRRKGSGEDSLEEEHCI